MWVRICSTGGASVMKATMHMSALQFGHVSGKDSNTGARSIVHEVGICDNLPHDSGLERGILNVPFVVQSCRMPQHSECPGIACI
jgi:hypothetical protein